MKNLNLNIFIKLLVYWYIFIFVSTEILSYFNLLERSYILLVEVIFWGFIFHFHRKKILKSFKEVNFRSKSLIFVLLLSIITFVQGFFSAPNTTDSMVYHIPRVMYWIQEKSVFQEVIRTSHDYMAPFGEYILLHLYLIAGSDRILFLSQWIAYVFSVYIIGLIAFQLGGSHKLIQLTRLFTATLPIAVMQSSSTQVDMVVTVLLLLSLHLALILKQSYSLKYLILLGFTLGLGFLTKATFAFYFLIPISALIFPLHKDFRKSILLLIPIFFIIFLLQSRLIYQNFSLYGNPLGLEISDKGGESVYVNDLITPSSVLSNLIRNFFVHMPVPFFSTFIQTNIINLHSLIGLDINDPRITCCGTEFVIRSIIYPQEDIVSNPIHLIAIVAGGILLIFKRGLNSILQIKILYLSTIVSFVLFSALIKWQPFHSRLEIPFFIVGTMCSIAIFNHLKILKPLYIGAILSCLLALIVVFFNVSRSYISYSVFYDMVKTLKPPLSSIPESFYLKPRDQQYFNARYYWYEPYMSVIELLKKEDKGEITLSLEDEFEYPFWILMKENQIDKKVIHSSQIKGDTIIISTSTHEFSKEGYITTCYKTHIEYGFACLSKSN